MLPDPAELAVLKELHDKKRQIAIEMRAILEFTKQSGASEADQSRYAELRRQWAEVDFEVTKRMSALTERKAVERRKGASRGKERRKRATEIRQQDRRSGEDRRMDDRRAGDDRRDPFPGDLPTQPMPKIDDPPSEA